MNRFDKIFKGIDNPKKSKTNGKTFIFYDPDEYLNMQEILDQLCYEYIMQRYNKGYFMKITDKYFIISENEIII